MSSNNTLLVIIPDHLSTLINKGEITDRYYNPGELFDSVHILMINNDRPDITKLQKTVGNAQLYLHNLPPTKTLFFLSLGWRPLLLRHWAKPAVTLAEQIKPALIRCHGNLLNAFVANTIKNALGIPYAVSLHTNLDENRRLWLNGSLKERLYAHAIKSIENTSLQHADVVLPVYRSIVPYLNKRRVKRYEVCYNVVNPTRLVRKTNYSLNSPVKLLSVGRQLPAKNPENIIRALALEDHIRLTLIGDGPLHDHLLALAKQLGLLPRVDFIKSLANDELCSMLHEYDIFAIHCDYGGIPKTVLEAFLVGMPVIINRPTNAVIPELSNNVCKLVDNSALGYHAAIHELLVNHAVRQELGQRAYIYASEFCSPQKAEQKMVSVYKSLIPLT